MVDRRSRWNEPSSEGAESDPVPVAEFLVAGAVAVLVADDRVRRLGLPGVPLRVDELDEFGVRDALLRIGKRDHPAVEAIELQPRQLDAEALHAMQQGV